MGRTPVFARSLTDEQRAGLAAGLLSRDAFVMRRCQILLASASGKRASQIAADLGCDTDTALNAINAFNQVGLGALVAGTFAPKMIRRAFARKLPNDCGLYCPRARATLARPLASGRWSWRLRSALRRA